MSTIALRTGRAETVGMSGIAEFGALIKRARQNMGLTQDEAAQRLGRPHTFLVRIENGRNANPPDPQTFDDLSRLFEIPKGTMLQALGYLEPEQRESGVAYIVQEGTARADLLDALEGESEDGVRLVIDLVALVRKSHMRNNDIVSRSKKAGPTKRMA